MRAISRKMVSLSWIVCQSTENIVVSCHSSSRGRTPILTLAVIEELCNGCIRFRRDRLRHLAHVFREVILNDLVNQVGVLTNFSETIEAREMDMIGLDTWVST